MDAHFLYLDDELIGALAWQDGGYTSFEYHPDYVKSGKPIAPLILPLNATNVVYGFKDLNKIYFYGMPSFLRDSLQRSLGVLFLLEKEMDFKALLALNPLQIMKLTDYYVRSGFYLDQPKRDVTPRKKRFFLEDISFRAFLFADLLRKSPNLGALFAYPADAQFEYSVCCNVKNHRISLSCRPVEGEEQSGWLYLCTDELMAKRQAAYFQMSLSCGIKALSSSIIVEKDLFALFYARDDELALNAIQGVRALSGIEDDKITYEQVFQLMRELRMPYKAFEQLFMRIVFNFMIGGQGLGHDQVLFGLDKENHWQLLPARHFSLFDALAPAYFASHGFCFANSHYKPLKHQSFIDLAKQQGIRRSAQLIQKLANAVAGWSIFARMAGIDRPDQHNIAEQHKTLRY